MKIKTSLFYSLAAATLMGGYANAQSVTDPVGFHTLTVFGSNDGSSRFSLISPGLVNAIEFAGAATANTFDAGTGQGTISVADTPFTSGEFDEVADSTRANGVAEPGFIAFYVEITTDGDPEEGAWANILSNTDGTLVIDRDLSAAGGTPTIAIRKHVTVADMFGATNEAGLDPGPSANEADQISLFANGVSRVFFYDDTADFEGYIDATFAARDNTPIEPQQAVYVNRRLAGDVVFTREGFVKVGPTKLQINGGFNAVAVPRAVGFNDDSEPVFTLGESNLFDGDDAANSVVPGAGANVADTVSVPQANGDFGVFFFDDTLNPATNEPFGWSDAAFADANNVVLDNGTGFLLNRTTNPSFMWTVPAEVIAP